MRTPLKIYNKDVILHYDSLIEEGNDPVLDSDELKAYMDKWDGQVFIDLLELSQEKSVLEIGCGTGRIAVKVAPKVKRFLGLDLSYNTVERAKLHLKNTNAEILKRDFLFFNSDERFDVIYSTLTFMHIEDKELAIKKAHELLNKGGRLVLSIDKNQANVLDYGTRSLKLYPDTPESLICILEQSGFKNVRLFQVEFAFILAADK